MTIAHTFEYARPASLAEALDALARNKDARVLAGGTDLVGWIREDLVLPPWLVDIKHIPGLRELRLDDKGLSIGACVTFNDLLRSGQVASSYPLLTEMAGKVASKGIRNRATMLGNICSAVPCNDSGPVLLVHEASVVVLGPQGERVVPVDSWFRGPRSTALETGELAVRIEIPPLPGEHAACWVKMGRYKGEDLAQASVACLTLADGRRRVAFGSVAPTPVRGRVIEELLGNSPLTPERIEAARQRLPELVAPITDIRASKEYRAHMLGVMLERALQTADDRLARRGPPYGHDII